MDELTHWPTPVRMDAPGSYDPSLTACGVDIESHWSGSPRAEWTPVVWAVTCPECRDIATDATRDRQCGWEGCDGNWEDIAHYARQSCPRQQQFAMQRARMALVAADNLEGEDVYIDEIERVGWFSDRRVGFMR